MGASYEIWVCDDAGRRLYLIPKNQFFNYARPTRGLGTCQIGAPFDEWVKAFPSVFRPDLRADIWRSPKEGVPARREGSFLLRKYNVYQRQDGVKVIEFFGRSPLDILRRQYITATASTPVTNEIDDLMKYLVTTYLVNATASLATVPTGEFAVDGDAAEGPSVSVAYPLKNLLDALNDLRDTSFAMNAVLSTNKKIYFDVVEDETLVTNGFGYRFRTWSTLRGADRTTGIEFSIENGNIAEPSYYEDYLDEFTSAEIINANDSSYNASVQHADRYLSRWNTSRVAQTSSLTDVNSNTSAAYELLRQKSADKNLSVTFINSPGSPIQPRSLYGLDWDLGDLLSVKFAGKVFQAEVAVVYVSVNDAGQETITGRNSIGEQ